MWFNYPKFYNYIASLPDMVRMVEVGCWHGESIAHLAKKLIEVQRPSFELWGVDIWEKWQTAHASRRDLKNAYAVYNQTLQEAGVRHLIKDLALPSIKAAKTFNDHSLDFVFIDADHRPQSVFDDIRAWLPKLRTGGILAGHDYYPQTLGHRWGDDDNVAEAIAKAVNQGIISKPTVQNTSVWMTVV
jgi:predicted O-methyltransferase YrrM